MDFIKLTKKFLELNREHPFSPKAFTMYFVLFDKFNSEHWGEDTEFEAKELQRLSGTNRNNYASFCKELASRNVIEYLPQKSGRNPKFRLLPIYEKDFENSQNVNTYSQNVTSSEDKNSQNVNLEVTKRELGSHETGVLNSQNVTSSEDTPYSSLKHKNNKTTKTEKPEKDLENESFEKSENSESKSSNFEQQTQEKKEKSCAKKEKEAKGKRFRNFDELFEIFEKTKMGQVSQSARSRLEQLCRKMEWTLEELTEEFRSWALEAEEKSREFNDNEHVINSFNAKYKNQQKVKNNASSDTTTDSSDQRVDYSDLGEFDF